GDSVPHRKSRRASHFIEDTLNLFFFLRVGRFDDSWLDVVGLNGIGFDLVRLNLIALDRFLAFLVVNTLSPGHNSLLAKSVSRFTPCGETEAFRAWSFSSSYLRDSDFPEVPQVQLHRKGPSLPEAIHGGATFADRPAQDLTLGLVALIARVGSRLHPRPPLPHPYVRTLPMRGRCTRAAPP